MPIINGYEIKPRADLSRADLYGAYLSGANLSGANLSGAKTDKDTRLPAYSIVPSEGAFTAFKRLRGGVIVKLLIPEDAERVSTPTGRKCRASKALVIEGSGVSSHDRSFKYEVGQIVEPREAFDDDWRVECTSGIHFFITREEAEAY